MKIAEFSLLVERAVKAIPKEFLEKLSNVEIVIEEEPSPLQAKRLRLHNGVLLFGLYEGVAKNVRGSHYSGVLPDKITIFKNPIEAISQSEADIEERVRDTVKHEIAHHFGMSEQEVRRAEAKRRKRVPRL